MREQPLERFDIALLDIAYDVQKLGDFIKRPDLNADNIQVLDFCGAKLHELVPEAATLLARLDAVRALHVASEMGFVVDLCRECHHTWPCPTVRTLDGSE